MRKIPFHRRVLPVIFVIAFLAIAPLIIFYTSGYRWNPKKGKVERYGTVIFDTVPRGAKILVDGRQIEDVTPITIQDMPPGTHRFELSRDGYASWGKSLDVLPEKVTFVNFVWLWKDSQPSLALASEAEFMSLSPDGGRVLLASASATGITIYDTAENTTAGHPLSATRLSSERQLWSDNGRYLLIGSRRQDPSHWLVDTFGQRQPLQLPTADYRWSDSMLVGNDGKSMFSIKGADFSLIRSPLPAGVQDITDLAEIRQATGTQNLVYVQLDRQDRGLVLPPGDWRFLAALKDSALLFDADRWLSLEFKKDPPEYHTVQGDGLRPLTVKRQTSYLTANGSEIWLWNGLGDPELVLRQGERIVGTAWHREGYNLFYATEKTVNALELDTRDRRLVTQLAVFDKIRGLSAYGKKLFVLGDRDGKSGLWTLEVE